MENWVSIYSTDKLYLAEIAKEIIFDHGIQAVVVNKRDSNYLFGPIEVHVPKDQAVRAKNALKKLEDASDESFGTQDE